MTERTCDFPTRRGGPSSGGGYDRMNRTHTEPCGRPVADGEWYCKRHAEVDRRQQARAQFKAEQRRIRQKRGERTDPHEPDSTWSYGHGAID